MADGDDRRFNLVLVHTEGWQDVSDFHAIAAIVQQNAPDIEVTIVSNASAHPVTRRKLRNRPTLLFSPIRLLNFRLDRGRIYCGKPISKLEEMRCMAEAGLPIPPFEEITPDTRCSPEVYGPLTIVKPSYKLAAWGQGIELVDTAEVRYRKPEEFDARHPGRMAPMIAQRFVDCGFPMSCRILTFFGRPIFTYCRTSTRPFVPDQCPRPFQQTDFMPAMPHSTASIVRDTDLLDVAARAYGAMPDVALQACDLMRDKDGNVFLLEVNPGGGTWMFSSPGAQGYRERLGLEDLWRPFDAFETCARLLIEHTRAEAE